MIFSLSKIFDN